ncbi:ATP-binding SpoIIE family protein phosphatase [Actinoplanes xinjiangensis]|uniref:ATP-binding SpoIIE family protein phosphatase n=1 Tax=Actinoplanes xinjiangensis TaxID=512350 RepID=UPI0034323123
MTSKHSENDHLRDQVTLLRAAVDAGTAALAEAEARLQAERDLVDRLQAVGQRLTSQLDMDALVQDATDAATQATGAAFGAFFYNVVNERGEAYTLYTLSGAPREAFSSFPMPRNTAVFGPTFAGEGVVRSDDITADARYGQNAPYKGMPAGHLPLRSYLAVPVVSATSREVLGGFFFGHPEPGQFTGRHEQLAVGIAGYAAIALDNARLFAMQRNTAVELQRSMLPTIDPVPGFEIASKYLPAATGSEVGGDWLDVISLPGRRTAFVMGDVMGRGVGAAAVMGQIRTAVRAYAALDLPPDEVMRHVSDLARTMPGHQFITCVYAVHDPVNSTLSYANAGHLPPAIVAPDGTVTFLRERLGLPLRIGTRFLQRQVDFPPGSGLALYTDGLVERRDRPVDDGIDELGHALRELATRPDTEADVACDKLIHQLTGGHYDDDVALLYARNTHPDSVLAIQPLTASPTTAAEARRFIRNALTAWQLEHVTDQAITVATELISNAVRHTQTPLQLRLHYFHDRLVIDVSDRDSRIPRRREPTPGVPGHRGLVLVEALTDRWGTRPIIDGKIVWAELVVPAAAPTDESS